MALSLSPYSSRHAQGRQKTIDKMNESPYVLPNACIIWPECRQYRSGTRPFSSRVPANYHFSTGIPGKECDDFGGKSGLGGPGRQFRHETTEHFSYRGLVRQWRIRLGIRTIKIIPGPKNFPGSRRRARKRLLPTDRELASE